MQFVRNQTKVRNAKETKTAMPGGSMGPLKRPSKSRIEAEEPWGSAQSQCNMKEKQALKFWSIS